MISRSHRISSLLLPLFLAARYIPLLISDGIKEIITKIAQDMDEDMHLKSFCQKVCDQAKKYLKEDVVKEDTPTPMEY